MTHRKTVVPWLYVAGGAALGLVALGTATRQRRRLARVATGESEAADRSRLAGDVSDIPIPVQEALAASARVHGLDHPLSEELTRDIFGQAVERRPVAGNERHEVSSLVGPRAIAPDERAVGEELADEPSADGDFTVQLTQGTRPRDEAYDAIAPEDLGSEWLTRATEGSATAEDEAPLLDTAEALRNAGLSVVSQESLEAASADELEAAATTELEGATDEELLELDELLEEDVTAILEPADALPGRPRRRR